MREPIASLVQLLSVFLVSFVSVFEDLRKLLTTKYLGVRLLESCRCVEPVILYVVRLAILGERDTGLGVLELAQFTTTFDSV